MRFSTLVVMALFMFAPAVHAFDVGSDDYPSCVQAGNPSDLCAETFPDTAPPGMKTTPPNTIPKVITTPPNTTTKSAGQDVTLMNPLGTGASLSSFLDAILAFVIRIGTIVIILMIILVGYKFVVAQGNTTKLEEARKNLLWTVVGALILLGAQAIAIGIEQTVQAISTGT